MKDDPSEELASLLVESAQLVRDGKRHDPVLQRTMEVFLRYMEHSSNGKTNSANNRPSNAGSSDSRAAVGGMFSRMINNLGGGAEQDPSKTREIKAETSRKNAERAKADLKADLKADPGGEENNKSTVNLGFAFPPVAGFTDSDSIKKAQVSAPEKLVTSGTGSDEGKPNNTGKSRAEFQRPANPKSALIANGWIEQQRRSKMRTVWKEVLASLVEGRKKGEETTLWIQRQVTNIQTNQTELEALHQIPVKWLEEVIYFDYSTDNRFSIKVYNLQEEFVFRCPKSNEAAQNWVSTLLSAKEASLTKRKSSKKLSESWDTNSSTSGSSSIHRKNSNSAVPSNSRIKSKDRVTATGKHNTSSGGIDETKLPGDSYFEEKKSSEQNITATSSPVSKQETPVEKSHKSIKELRAIAHGAGIQTIGMERSELEAVVTQIEASQNDWAGPSNSTSQGERKKQSEKELEEHERRRKEEQQSRVEAEVEHGNVAEEGQERANGVAEERSEEEVRLYEKQKRQEEEEAARIAQEEEHRRRIAERVRSQQQNERKMREEEERARLERERIEREEAEHQRRVAELRERERQEQMRRQQEEYARQQKAWQEQQAEAARQARVQAEHEARLREEEARRRREAERWANHQSPPPHGYPQPQQAAQQPPNFAHPPPQGYPQQQAQHPGFYQHHQQVPPAQPHVPPQGPPPPQHAGFYQQQQQHTPPPYQQHGHTHPQQQQQQAPPQSTINQKYAKMANSDEGTANQKIKHDLLVQWALQPPTLQALKPIELLITSVHTVFPPSFGVVGHEYFSKWKAVQIGDIAPPGQRIDEDKLNKAVRKLRFFLHPDKLPKDLTADQSFLIKLLWDITNDAFEDHKKREEDLGWIRS